MQRDFSLKRRAYYSFRSADLLPFLDSVFAVAFTLVALSIPDELHGKDTTLGGLALILSTSALSSLAVLLYWFKTRRLVVPARQLYLPQLLLLLLSMLVIVTLPQTAAIALRYGQSSGNLFAWTPSQTANMLFLGMLSAFDLLLLGFTISLRRHPHPQVRQTRLVQISCRTQTVGFLILLGMGVLELLSPWFNNQYILLVPLVLLTEEIFTARRLTAS